MKYQYQQPSFEPSLLWNLETEALASGLFTASKIAFAFRAEQSFACGKKARPRRHAPSQRSRRAQ